MRADRIPLLAAIEDLLPQTQCGKCLHPGCKPYAEAIAAGEAINHCVPGGEATIKGLAALLNEAVIPLDPNYGEEPQTRRVAYIREEECIGCTKCIQACPVDAIIGAGKLMHTVISAECTGCDLCLAPCPVDCIDIRDFPKITDPVIKKENAARAKKRYEIHQQRYQLLEEKKSAKIVEPEIIIATQTPTLNPIVAAALLRTSIKKIEKKRDAAIANQEHSDIIQSYDQEITQLQQQLSSLITPNH